MNQFVILLIPFLLITPGIVVVDYQGGQYSAFRTIAVPEGSNNSSSGIMSYVSATYDYQHDKITYGYAKGKSSGVGPNMMYYCPDNGILYFTDDTLVNSGTQAAIMIQEVNVSTWTPLRSFVIPRMPVSTALSLREWVTGIAFDPENGMLYATATEWANPPFRVSEYGYLYEIDPANGSVLKTIDVGTYTGGLVYDVSTNMLLVSSSLGDLNDTNNFPTDSLLYEISPERMDVNGSISSGYSLGGPYLDPYNGEIYVPDFKNYCLYVVNSTTYNSAKVDLTGKIWYTDLVTFSPNAIYLGSDIDNYIGVVNPHNNSYEGNISLRQFNIFILGISYDPIHSILYASAYEGEIYAIYLKGEREIQELSIGGIPAEMTYDSSLGTTLVGAESTREIAELNVGAPHKLMFYETGLIGSPNWKVDVNGLSYDFNQVSGSVLVAGNMTYYVPGASGYLSFPGSGEVKWNATGTASISIAFVQYLFIVGPVSVAVAIFSFLLIRRFWRKSKVKRSEAK